MAFLARDFEDLLKQDTFHVFDDFDHYVTADTFTTVATDSGTIAVGDGAGGIVKIDPSSDGGDSQAANDETYLKGTTEIFKFATDKPFFMATKARPYANTIGTIGLIVGVKDAVAANSLQDTTGGPAASYSGAVFFKDSGTTYWKCESSVSTSQTTVTTEHTVANNAWDILVIEGRPISSTTTEIHFYSADVQTDGDYTLAEVGLDTSGTNFVAQTLTHTSATEMQICLGCKAGTANNSQYLDVDWVYAAQRR